MEWTSTDVVFALALALAAGCAPSSAPSDASLADDVPAAGDAVVQTFGAPVSGIATYYDATGAGNCSFDPSPDDLMVTAIDLAQYASSAVCGECVHVTGPRGEVTVRIVDSCPDCESGHLDLSAQAFAIIADPVQGRVPITWQPVSCAVSGPIAFRFKEGSSQWWTAIQVRNHRVPVTTLEAQVNGAWMPLERQDYNYFVASSGLGPGPYTLRVTSVAGEQLVSANVPLRVGEVVAGTGQFQ